MPSFDIESQVDDQSLDNAINNLKKEILNRFDFQGTNTAIELDKKDKRISILTDSEMRVRQVEDVLISKLLKQKLDPQALDATEPHYAAGNMTRKEIVVKSGISKDTGRKIIKMIKSSKLKVQAQIMDDKIRVTGKKIDDLQAVMKLLKEGNLGIPLQFVNMKK